MSCSSLAPHHRNTESDASACSLAAAIDGFRTALIGVFIFSALMNALLLTGPFYMLQIYDRVLTSRSLSTLVALSLLVVVLFAAYGLFDFVRNRLMGRIAILLDLKLADDIFNATVRSGLPQNVPSNPMRDLTTVRQFLSGPAASGLFDVPWIPAYLGVIFLLHPMLGYLAVIGGLLLVAIAALNSWASQEPALRASTKAIEEDRLINVSRANVETVQAMGMLGDLRGRFQEQHREALSAAQNGADINAHFVSLSRTLRLILQSSILGFGAWLVIGDTLSSGAMIAASIIFARALHPVDAAIAQWRSVVAAHHSWKRLKQILARIQKPTIKRTEIGHPSQRLDVKRLCIAAPDRKSALVQDVTLHLSAGDGLGIIGTSGSGKSSLVRGLVGVWPAAGGEMRLDGAILNQWSEEARRNFIGYLPQDVHLFDGTIAENIARFRPDATSEEIVASAKLAGVHELILTRPEGYETLIGTRGITLSAGQRQRIALARAVFRTPFLIVLDEPNAHLDAVGETALADAIAALREAGSIVIVVAHRRAAIACVNKLMLMDSGKVLELGPKEQVLATMAEQTKAAAAARARYPERGLSVVNR